MVLVDVLFLSCIQYMLHAGAWEHNGMHAFASVCTTVHNTHTCVNGLLWVFSINKETSSIITKWPK